MKRLVVIAYAHVLPGGITKIEMREFVVDSHRKLQEKVDIVKQKISATGQVLVPGTMTVGNMDEKIISEMSNVKSEKEK